MLLTNPLPWSLGIINCQLKVHLRISPEVLGHLGTFRICISSTIYHSVGVLFFTHYRVEFDSGRSNRLYIRVSDGKQGAPTAPALHNSVKCPPAAAYLACESVSGQKKQSLKRDSAVCAETDSARNMLAECGEELSS